MIFMNREIRWGSLIIKYFFVSFIFLISQSAFSEYYVVYSTPACATPMRVVYYKPSCHPCHVKKHKYKKPSCHHIAKKKHYRSQPIVTVYKVINNPCAQSCQYTMPTCQACGYRVFYGAPVWHSDYYYMQGFDEDDPVIDGNTYDNDIY
jgi:hypothetical protein